ncbi:MAG TPA: FAD-dependent oxidoreductase [Candidatus Polarisedimenticolia bacterium]|nr:FAD-dependent oxidoreductase [Candidatus Polarisedimenticolia bacterium]
MSQSYDIVIVGAGIVGAACAMECSRGGLRTLVLDRGPIAGGTTAAGMGHLVVMDDSEAQFALTSFSRRLWHEIRPRLPREVEFDACGTLWVASDDEEMAEVRRKEKFYHERGVRVEVLDEKGVAKWEPNLRPAMAGGLRVLDDAVVYPPCAAQFFLEEAKKSGTELRTGVAVKALLPEGGVELADGSKISCGRSVSAGGPWSPELMPGLPVRKRKGHLVITDREPGFVHHQIVELGYLKSAHSMAKDSVAFNIQPRITGQVLIGSSRQFDAEDSAVDHEILNRMLQRAFEYLPGLARLSAIRVWTGHRAATPDKVPIIGPSTVSDRIWLATGHEGLGITTSLGTARLLADLLLDRSCEISPEPFAPSRFSKELVTHE